MDSEPPPDPGRFKSGDDKRALLEILKAKDPKPSTLFLDGLRVLADRQVTTLKAAVEHQAELNTMLQPWDAFVLSSDLEGMLLDVVGQEKLARMLGPDETGEVSKETAEAFATGLSGREAMAAHLGAKGWNSDGKKSGKAKPHVPSAGTDARTGDSCG